MDRREVLKMFGIGAMVVPIVGSKPVREAAATLIEVPKLEPAALEQTISTQFKSEHGFKKIVVHVWDEGTGEYLHIRADRFVITQMAPSPALDQIMVASAAPAYIRQPWETRFEFEGVIIPNEKGESFMLTKYPAADMAYYSAQVPRKK